MTYHEEPYDSDAADDLEDGPVRVAVIGLAGRFPGATNVTRFWANLRDGLEGITFFEDDELLVAGVTARQLGQAGYVKAAPILEDIAAFDAHFFGYTPREAEVLDPQQRIFLETAWEALENAGWNGESHKTAMGVFAGSSLSHYLMHHLSHTFTYNERGFESLIGNDKDYLASRLAYKLDLGGPSIAVQTACSTSLVAIHLACQSLLNFECDMALAGGVTLRLPVRAGYLYQEGGLFSPDGHCRPFDAAARGTMFGSGAGVVVLKRLSEAQEDGDRVRAVILGSAVNNDGARKVGYTAPGETGQVRVISEALGIADVPPASIGYLETHGTGTALGDPIEAAALRRVFGEQAKPGTCALGSVKSNLGHLECAAGVAGFIKTVLVLEQGQIPPMLHFTKLNPHIDFQGTPFYINAKLCPWPSSAYPRRAGVSSFGIGGTNAHIILEQAPEPLPRKPQPSRVGSSFLALSARCEASLHALAAAYDYRFSGSGPLETLCANAALRRSHHVHRLAVVGADRSQLAGRLEAFGRGEIQPGLVSGQFDPGKPKRIVFVYPGQGSQWRGMGRSLLQNQPVFAKALKECSFSIERHAGFSVIDVLMGRLDERFEDVDVVQPCLFAMGVALTKLWISWGIEPDALIGHSQGEIAAACVAGVLTVDEAALVVCCRSRLVRELEGQGSMAVAELAEAQALQILAELADPVAIAAVNGPRSVVFSGPSAAMDSLLAELDRQSIYNRRVNVTYASHSRQVEPVLNQLAERLAGLRPKAGNVPLYSTVTGEKVDGATWHAAYWCQNLRQQVRFAEMVQHAEHDGMSLFLEVSPHPVLLHALKDTVGTGSRVLASLRRDEDESQALFEGLGQLYCQGKTPKFSALFEGQHDWVDLPSYPWQRQHFWIEAPPVSAVGAGSALVTSSRQHALLAGYLSSSTHKDTWYWQLAVGTEFQAFLADHQVQGQVIVPAAFYMELALAAAWQVFDAEQVTLDGMAILQPLFLPEGSQRLLQVVLTKEAGDLCSFTIASSEPQQELWTQHVRGQLRHGSSAERGFLDLGPLRDNCPRSIEPDSFYQNQLERGLAYGPAFRPLQEIHAGNHQALARLELPDSLDETADYRFHPAFLDGCFQVLLAAAPLEESRTFLPVSLEQLQFLAQPQGEVWVHASLNHGGPEGSASGNLRVYDEDGLLVCEAKGLTFRVVEEDQKERLAGLRFNVSWVHDPNQNTQTLPDQGDMAPWLIFADKGGTAKALAADLAGYGATTVLAVQGETYLDLGHEVRLDPQRRDHLAKLLNSCAFSGIAYLWGLDCDGLDLEQALRQGSDPLLNLVQLLQASSKKPSLTVVSRGGRAIGTPTAQLFAQAPLLALAAVVASEDPGLNCRCIDLDPNLDNEQAEPLLRELLRPDGEDRVAWRGGIRLLARLVHHRQEHAALQRPSQSTVWRLETDQPGSLDGLHLRETDSAEPGPGELKIEIKAAGLNFRDVLTAMERRGDAPQGTLLMGGECAGIVVGRGEGVVDFALGDEVVALALPAFAAFAIVPSFFVQPKPSQLSFAEAACMLITPLTAHLGLIELARLQSGERVLIHSGTGGTGLAAIYIAQQVGAEIFATAGSPEKRGYLQGLGIKHVYDSRSLDFAEKILAATNGQGVDVVLNSLSGEGLVRSLEVLAPYGRFIELGISDIYANTRLGLYPFHKNLSYHSLNLARMMVDRPLQVSRQLRLVLAQIEDGIFPVLPVRAFPFGQVADAFGLMARAGHIGKIALMTEAEPKVKAKQNTLAFDDRASYLVTGGLSGLGLLFAEWLVKRGVRQLILLGRRTPDDAVGQRIENLRSSGTNVTVVSCDVSDGAQLAQVLAQISHQHPLRGILHAAGTLDDGPLDKQSPQGFRNVMAAKVGGALHLQRLTESLELDFFVLFSSTASLLGPSGQANYAAANACLDALAWLRSSQGKPTLSVNWGGWAQVGMAAAHLTGAAYRFGIEPQLGLAALEQVLSQAPTPQLAITAAPIPPLLLGRPHKPPFYELLDFARPSMGGDPGLREKLSQRSALERQALMEEYLVNQVALVLRIPAHEIQADTPLNTYGLTSLFALELRNRVESDVHLPIQVLQFFQDRDLRTFASRLLERLALSAILETQGVQVELEGDDEDYDEITL